jgi:hypothetical protein
VLGCFNIRFGARLDTHFDALAWSLRHSTLDFYACFHAAHLEGANRSHALMDTRFDVPHFYVARKLAGLLLSFVACWVLGRFDARYYLVSMLASAPLALMVLIARLL